MKTHRRKIQVTYFGKVMKYNNLKISDFLVLGAPRTQKVHQEHESFILSASSFKLSWLIFNKFPTLPNKKISLVLRQSCCIEIMSDGLFLLPYL